MKWSPAVIALAFALTAADPARACYSGGCDLATIKDNYRLGHYLAAAESAEVKGSAEALTIAARARIADAITREDGMCLSCLVKAEEIAQAAIDATQQNSPQITAEAYAQLAIAIGFHGRMVSTLEAQSEGLAEKGRAAIDRALELDPLNSWARASLGGWHLEIVHRAGGTLASLLYGANEEEGLKHFRAALSQDRGSLLLHYHYALSILALDPERFRDEALLTLQAQYKDADALTAFTRKRADHLLDVLRTGDNDAIAKLVHRYQGYPED
jgi:tetratricopeptide (TPR) repeat protein